MLKCAKFKVAENTNAKNLSCMDAVEVTLLPFSSVCVS